jgi:hypothetical protein
MTKKASSRARPGWCLAPPWRLGKPQWFIDEVIWARLVANALRKASDLRGGTIAGTIFHSDLGPSNVFLPSTESSATTSACASLVACFANRAAESLVELER